MHVWQICWKMASVYFVDLRLNSVLKLHETSGTEQQNIGAADPLCRTVLYLAKVMIPPRLLGDRVGRERGGWWHPVEQQGSFRPPQPYAAVSCWHQRTSLSQLGLEELLQQHTLTGCRAQSTNGQRGRKTRVKRSNTIGWNKGVEKNK